MTANPVLWDLDKRGVATVTLNRPEVNNAYDAGLINGVLAAMDELGSKPNLRVVVLKGNGKHFQAGADLKWIDAVRTSSAQENIRVSRATAEARIDFDTSSRFLRLSQSCHVMLKARLDASTPAASSRTSSSSSAPSARRRLVASRTMPTSSHITS